MRMTRLLLIGMALLVGRVTWGSTQVPPLYLYRDVADTLAMRNGVTAQSFFVYNTWANAGTDYERAGLSFTANDLYFGTYKGGTGGSRNLFFVTAGGSRWEITSAGYLLAVADNTYDIGASGATRPRNVYAGTSVVAPAIIPAQLSTASGLTLTLLYDVVLVTATGQTITLPTAVGNTGKEYTIKLTASGTCTIATTASQNIDAATTYSLSAQYKYVKVASNGTQWWIIANN